MKAVSFALKIYCKDMHKVSIQFKIDNTSTVVWITKQAAPNKKAFDLVKEFWELCRREKYMLLHKVQKEQN